MIHDEKLYMFHLLEENTSKKGTYTLHFNDHKGAYSANPKEYWCLDEEDLEDFKNVDWTKDIYWLCWYKNTPVGSYDFYANTLEELAKEVIKFIDGDD